MGGGCLDTQPTLLLVQPSPICRQIAGLSLAGDKIWRRQRAIQIVGHMFVFYENVMLARKILIMQAGCTNEVST